MANGTAAAELKDAGAVGPAIEAWAAESLDPDETLLWHGGTDTRALLLLAAEAFSATFGIVLVVASLLLTHHAFTTTPAGASLNAQFTPGGAVTIGYFLVQMFLLPTLISGLGVVAFGRVYALTDRRLLVARRHFGRFRRFSAMSLDGATEIGRTVMTGGAWKFVLYGQARRPKSPLGGRFRYPPRKLCVMPGVERAEELERALITECGLPRITGPGADESNLAISEYARLGRDANHPSSLTPGQERELGSLLVEGERVLMAAAKGGHRESRAGRAVDRLWVWAWVIVTGSLLLGVAFVAAESVRMLFSPLHAGAAPSALWAFATTGDMIGVGVFWTLPVLFLLRLIPALASAPTVPVVSAVTDRRCIAADGWRVRSYGSVSAKFAAPGGRFSPKVTFNDNNAINYLLNAREGSEPELLLKEPHAVTLFIRRAFAGEEEKDRPG
ncbi:MAG: hypothetical protein JJU33_14595 [Phycisphaerales bacterium]|nr:hypothetical protein [Phycisphaerales bacterium]